MLVTDGTMTCTSYQRSSSGCITLQRLPYRSPLMFGFRIASGMKSRLVFSLTAVIKDWFLE
jgi:hypothetical protein